MTKQEDIEFVKVLEAELEEDIKNYRKYSNDTDIDKNYRRKKLLTLQIVIGRKTNLIKKLKEA